MQLRRITALLTGVLLLALGWATASDASHFRGGFITWKPRPDVSPTAAEFTVQQSWRRSSCGGTAGDGYVAVGDPACFQTSIDFGDGAFEGVGGTVVSIDVGADWYLQSFTTVHDYPSANNAGSPWQARYDSCCRIYGNVNAPGTSFTQIATVDLAISNSSPVTTVLPIIAMGVNAVNSVALPLGDVDSDTLSCRLATFAESGIAVQPSANNPLSVSPGCVVNWDTTGTVIGQLWATSIVVEESRGGDPSHGQIPIEFLILIVDDLGEPPVCDEPPTPTGTVNIPAGVPYVATIQGSDLDAGQTLTLNGSGIPSWCVLAPAVPTSSLSPVSSQLTCNPTVADAGPHPFFFSITDPTFQADFCSFTLNVIPNQPPDCSGAAADPGTLWPPNHALTAISVVGVTDPDGDPITITATLVKQDEAVTGKGIGSGNTTPDAQLSPLAVRAERNGNPKTPGDGRVYEVSFTADDGQGGSCNGKVEVCVPHDQRPGSTCVDGGPLYNSIP